MMKSLKARIFKLLREDEEFRYAVVGMLGLEDIRSSVSKLVEAQLKVEERLSRLEEAHIKLEQAHIRLEERVGKLWEAHIRLEERVSRLEEAQRNLAENVNALAEAQRRTEESLKALIEQVGNLSREVGGLSDVVGFGLEDIARVVVPGWLHRHEGIMVDKLVRRFFYVDGVEVEVNLYGEGVKEGRKILVIGEARSRIYRREVLDFYRSVEKVLETVKEPVYLFMFAYFIHPSAEEEARSRGIRLIASYMR